MAQKPFALSVKAVVRDGSGQCLVLRRAVQSKINPGLWDLPGGRCDPGEAIEDALAREVAEETGLKVQMTRVVGSAQSDLDDRVVAYLIVEARAIDGQVRLGPEHDTYSWQSHHRLADLPFSPEFQEFVHSFAQAGPSLASPRPLDEDRYRNQIRAYGEALPDYEAMADSLIAVLKRASKSLGLHCIVQARAKTIASFAEKILRPGKDYADPLRDLTDLCGARIIAKTLGDVAAVCRFVEDHFQVSWPDSGDKLEGLAASEFGYLSRHFIVSYKPDVFPTEVVPEDLITRGVKAEIQVRTILQHAWADIHHDLSYKSRFKLPRTWRREFARLAATLEEADRDFEVIRRGLNEYASSYGAYYTEDRLREEIGKLGIVLEADPDKDPGIVHQLAKMTMSLGDWDRAIEVLEPFAERGPAPLVRDLGVSLCKRHRKQIGGPEFARGQALLRHATEIDPTDIDSWASLGGTWRARENATQDIAERAECRQQAAASYRRAFEVDPTNPYALGNYLEYEIARHPDVDIVGFVRPSLEAASRRCRAQAEVGVNLPWAYFDLGKFQLMLGEPYEALGFYARGIGDSPAAFFLDSAVGSFTTLAAANRKLPGLDWSHGLLRLARVILFQTPDSEGPSPTPGANPLSEPVVIVVGYCDRTASDQHRALFREAFRDYRGTILSGGTEAGIPAVVGELQETLGGAVRTIGYAPGRLPDGVRLDPRYSELRRSAGTDFSPREVLQSWADLHASGISIDRVKLLAVGGGRLSACECQMALAFGAAVGLVEVGGSAVGQCLADPLWAGHRRLQILATDASAVRKFLLA